MEWSWIQGDYVVIPRSKAKGGRGKVARIPPAIRHRLDSIREPGSRYVFAGWVEDVKRFATYPTRIKPFEPHGMVGQMEKLIAPFAEPIGRPEISHHALRRTLMELGEEAEAHARRLTPLQRQRLAKRLLEGDAGGEGHGVA